jgi:hypothetical protein
MFLNDANQQVWNDGTLLPMFVRAYGELLVTLRQRAANLLKAQTEPTLLAPGTKVFPSGSDLVAPIQLIEAAPGGVGSIMTEADPLPLRAQQPTLDYWHWDGIDVTFIGANQPREVMMFYWRTLPIPTNPVNFIEIIDGEMWLAPRTAAIAAASVGEENTSGIAASNADAFLERVILANRGRAAQTMGTSIRP